MPTELGTSFLPPRLVSLSLTNKSTRWKNSKVTKQSDQFLKQWSDSQKVLSEDNSTNGSLFSDASLHELLLARYCFGFFSNSFVDFEARCEIAASRNRLFQSFLEWNKGCSGAIASDINLAEMSFGVTPDPFSLLMQLVAHTSGQKTHGVFYTPKPIAKFAAQKAWNGINELCPGVKSVAILEPSVGSGVFIEQCLRLLGTNSVPKIANRLKQLNVTGVDLSPAAILITEFLLADPNYQFDFDLQISLFAGNTLTAKSHPIYQEFEAWRTETMTFKEDVEDFGSNAEFALRVQSTFEEAVRRDRYDLVIGNPPFAALTAGTDPWAGDLLHGRNSDDGGSVSYFEVDGQSLGEKKTWLHDDYVKFLRYAHWQIDRNGTGCVALVLNSGFINNLTFRGLRYQLAKSFDLIEVIDFGGDQRNRKDKEDENIFGIETGIAVLILGKERERQALDQTDLESSNGESKSDPTKREIERNVKYWNLYGTVREKFDWCDRFGSHQDEHVASNPPEVRNVRLVGPKYRFDQSPSSVELKYEKGWCVTEIFLNHWSAPVTARDHLIIDVSHGRLVKRIEAFLDPLKSDDEIRKSFFSTPRSNRYPQGDTRGWSLSAAREKLRQLDWEKCIIECDYRPFDQRFILWMPELIDWPRSKFREQFSIEDNPCFITRRQGPQDREYDYFWMTNYVPLDGIVRSDNRGNEYCFPKLVRNPSGASMLNLSEGFRQYLTVQFGLAGFQHEMAFDYIYGFVFCNAYRNLFANELPQSFPRVFLPNIIPPHTKSLFKTIADCGRRLRITHTEAFAADSICDEVLPPQGKQLGKRPEWKDGKLLFCNGQQIEMEEEVWTYRIGTHQVCRKLIGNYWRHFSADSLSHRVNRVATRIRQSLSIQSEIETAVENNGGFERSFL